MIRTKMFTNQINKNEIFTESMANEYIQRRIDAGYKSEDIEDFHKYVGCRKLYFFSKDGNRSQYLYTFENQLDDILTRFSFTGNYMTSALLGKTPVMVKKT